MISVLRSNEHFLMRHKDYLHLVSLRSISPLFSVSL